MGRKDFAITIRRRKPTHFVSKNKKIRIWYKRLGCASNAHIVKTLKLVNSIDLVGNKYNLNKIFIDSDIKDKNNNSNLDFLSTTIDSVANAAVFE